MPIDVAFQYMGMDSMNISLPPAMAEFVRRKVEADYGNVSEFFRELVREKIQREIEADLAVLESTNENASPGPNEKEIEHVLAVQKRVRKSRRARGL
jgi:Arc/MetJ-type ribon-helix-helix transcriptional regulator